MDVTFIDGILQADNFGLWGGLSRLAGAAGARTVIVGGFSLPNAEFETPYRANNLQARIGGRNGPALPFRPSRLSLAPPPRSWPASVGSRPFDHSGTGETDIQRIAGFLELHTPVKE